jgi:hypothetical protein
MLVGIMGCLWSGEVCVRSARFAEGGLVYGDMIKEVGSVGSGRACLGVTDNSFVPTLGPGILICNVSLKSINY